MASGCPEPGQAGLDSQSASRGWFPAEERAGLGGCGRLPDGLTALCQGPGTHPLSPGTPQALGVPLCQKGRRRGLEQPPPTPGLSVPEYPTAGPRPHSIAWGARLWPGAGPRAVHFPAMRSASWASWAATGSGCNDRAGPFDLPDQRLPRLPAGPGRFSPEKTTPPSQSLPGLWEVGCTGQPRLGLLHRDLSQMTLG